MGYLYLLVALEVESEVGLSNGTILDDLSLPKLHAVFPLVQGQHFQKVYVTDLCEVFRMDSLFGRDDCCEMGSRSLKGYCHGNQLCFTQSTQFFDKCVLKVVQSSTTVDGLDGRKRNTRRRLRRFLLTTPLHHGTDTAPTLETDIPLPPQTFP